MQIHRHEITTGLLVLVSGAALLGVLVVIGMPGVIHPMHTYRIYFDDASGIRPGAPVLLAGREIGKVGQLRSPIPPAERPKDHPEDEVSIDVEVDRDAQIYRSATVRLTQQSLLGQQVIDFVHENVNSGLAPNRYEFVGEREPDMAEAINDNLKRLTGPGSDFAETLRNARIFMETLNRSDITQVIHNASQMTDTLKREPWRLLWPSTKDYPGDEPARKERHKADPDEK